MDLKRFTELENDTVKLTGVPVVYGDRPGRNKNMYPKEELVNAITWWEKIIRLDPTYKYSLVKHPKDTSEESFELVAGVIEKLYYDDDKNCLLADFKLLPTTWGLLISYLAKKNYPVGVSLRGDADPTYTSMSFNDRSMDVTVRKNLKLEGIDFVLYPSFITTQVTSSNVTESRDKNIYKVLEGFKQEYKNILEDVEIDKLNNLYTNNTNRGGNNMSNVNKDAPQDIDNKDVSLELEKTQILRDRLELDIDKLQARAKKEEDILTSIIAQSASAKEELDGIKSNIGNKTGELDALLTTKLTYEEETVAKKKEIDDITGVIESKQTELKEIEELNVLETKNNKTTVVLKKKGKIFSSENKPVVRMVSPDERISKSSWGSVDTIELSKISYLSDGMNDCFAFIDKNVEGWEKYKYPVYQLFHSDEEGVDFDAVLNINGLKTAVEFMQSKSGIALDSKEKKSMFKYFAKQYKYLEEIGQGELPESLKKVSESKIIFETTKPYLDMFLEGLLADNIIDLDESEVVEQTDENSEDVIIKLDDENTSNTLQSIAEVLSNILGENDIQPEIVEKAVEEAVEETKETEDITVVDPIQFKISAEDARRVVEQFNPDDTSININNEISEFVELVLRAEDGAATPFAETYELKDGADVYAMYGVIKDNFVNGDFTSSLQILKALTGTLFVNIKNAPSVNIQSTEATEDINTFDNINAPQTDAPAPATDDPATDVTSDVPAQDPILKLTDVQIINYAFNMSTLILSKYDTIQDIFNTIASTDTADASQTTPIETPPSDMGDSSNVNTNEQTVNDNNETKIFEQNNNGGIEMDATKLIEMIKENFDSQDDINETNVLEAVGSIISDFVEMSKKCNELEIALNDIKTKELMTLKEEKTRTLESLGVEKTAIENAFESVNTQEEIEAKYEELNSLLSSVTNKVTESTQKVTLSRKGTANPDEVVVTSKKDDFDKIMDSI